MNHRWLIVGFFVLVAGCAPEPAALEDFDFRDATADGIFESDVEARITAQEQAVARCMAEIGFDYETVDVSERFDASSDDRAYGATEALEEAAEAWGSQEPPPARPPGYGDAAQGCLEARLAEHDRRMQQVASDQALLEAAWGEHRSSEDYLDAERAWSACMADAGYDYSGPDEPRAEFNDRVARVVSEAGGLEALLEADGAQLPEIAEEELSVHEADQACRAETIDPVEAEFFQDLYREEGERFLRIREAYVGEG